MRDAKKELNVDFIGGHEPLTAAEAEAISSFLQGRKKQSQSKQPKSENKKSAISIIVD